MQNFLFPILSVGLGFLIVLLFKPKQNRNLKLLLAFSGSFLLSTTVFHFLPEVYNSHGKPVGLFIMIGILLQIILEFFSKGAEHGHVHIDKSRVDFPWLLFISLSIHSVLEGIPIEAHEHLIYGIIIHKLPVAIILSTFFLASDISKIKCFIFLILFALMTPLGVFLSMQFEVFENYYYEVSALVIGIFLHISTTILFESSEGHKFNLAKLSTIILGIVLAYLL